MLRIFNLTIQSVRHALKPRRSFLLFIAILSLANALLYAQPDAAARHEDFDALLGYPTDDAPIDVTPPEPVALRSVWLEEFDDGGEALNRWTAGPGVKLAMTSNALVVDSDVVDPYFFSPKLTTVPDGYLLLKLRLRRSTWDDGRLYYAEELRDDFDEVHSISFPITKERDATFGDEIRPDAPFRDYVVPFKADSPVTRLRFDLGNSEGRVELARVELLAVEMEPLKFGVATASDGKLCVELMNVADEDLSIELASVGANHNAPETLLSRARSTLKITREYPTDSPFHSVELIARRLNSDKPLRRRFFLFNENACEPLNVEDKSDFVTLRSGDATFRFDADGCGAEIFHKTTRVAAIWPLLCEDGDGAKLTPLRIKNEESVVEALNNPPTTARLSLGRGKLDADRGELVFTILERRFDDDNHVATVGELRFSVDHNKNVLHFHVDAPRNVHAPVIRALGTMEQAILPGVEYLERGEHSSSSADLTTDARIRFAPPTSWITQPYVAFVSDRGALTTLYDDPTLQPFFAVPNFIDGESENSRFNLAGRKISGKIRVAEQENIEESVCWAVNERGLPDPPQGRGETLKELVLKAYQTSAITTDGGWIYTIFRPEGEQKFPPSFGSDHLAVIYDIVGEFPDVPRVDVDGGYLHDRRYLLLSGNGRKLADALDARRRRTLAEEREDGSFRYSGRFLRGSDVDYASGYSGTMLSTLAEDWRLTRNRDALEGLLKGLEFVNRLRTPRGAQTWEIPLHTPDILAASRCAFANVVAYEATDDKGYLAHARRWALAGLPFVYLWEDASLRPSRRYPEEETADRTIIMKYATIAVYGATEGNLTCWLGRPVQWCGLDYAAAILQLAKYDATVDWRKVAEGIVASAEEQTHVGEIDKGFVGLLPDSYDVGEQRAYGGYFPPTAVWILRNELSGRRSDVDVVDVAGRRVVAPLPARAEGDVICVEGKAGLQYQLLVDGETIIDVLSTGEDRIVIPPKAAK